MRTLRPSPDIARYIFDSCNEGNVYDCEYEDGWKYIESAFHGFPWYVGLPVGLMQIFFHFYCILKNGYSFGKCSYKKKKSYIKLWCSIGRPCESLVRLYYSLMLLVLYEKSLRKN